MPLLLRISKVFERTPYTITHLITSKLISRLTVAPRPHSLPSQVSRSADERTAGLSTAIKCRIDVAYRYYKQMVNSKHSVIRSAPQNYSKTVESRISTAVPLFHHLNPNKRLNDTQSLRLRDNWNSTNQRCAFTDTHHLPRHRQYRGHSLPPREPCRRHKGVRLPAEPIQQLLLTNTTR